MTMPSMAGAAGGQGGTSAFASPIGQDRLVRKEVSLGAIRDIQPPQGHIGLSSIAPFLDVESDDVIFDYLKGGLQDGLAPARAEDSEAELSQKDLLTYGQGRAAIIDWSLADRYTASDVSRYRQQLLAAQALQGQSQVPVTLNWAGRAAEEFAGKVAQDDAMRRRKLDNRLEWMIMQAIQTGQIVYNDGKIKFTVNYGRPAGQQDQAPASGLYSTTTFDPIGDLIAVNDFMYNLYGVRLYRAICSQKVFNTFWKSNRFISMTGLVVGGTPSSPIDMNYLMAGQWGPQAAVDIVERATGIKFEVYDSVYRTRPIGGQTFTNNRFLADDRIFLLPTPDQLSEVDNTKVGFAKTLTSPHPEGNWSSGYYEWEEETRNPWMQVRGTGIKAFPIFPYMQYTYVMKVL